MRYTSYGIERAGAEVLSQHTGSVYPCFLEPVLGIRDTDPEDTATMAEDRQAGYSGKGPVVPGREV